MTISYPLELPQVERNGVIITFASVKLSAINNVALTSSVWTFKTFTQAHKGQMWKMDLSLPVMEREHAMPWVAWLIALKGKRGTFLCGDPSYKEPLGYATGTPVVSGNQTAGSETITVTGWSANTSNILKASDYIQIGTHLYMVLEDVVSNASGTTEIPIFPMLRENVSNGMQVITENPKGLFRLATDTNAINVNVAHHYSISFSALEAF